MTEHSVSVLWWAPGWRILLKLRGKVLRCTYVNRQDEFRPIHSLLVLVATRHGHMKSNSHRPRMQGTTFVTQLLLLQWPSANARLPPQPVNIAVGGRAPATPVYDAATALRSVSTTDSAYRIRFVQLTSKVPFLNALSKVSLDYIFRYLDRPCKVGSSTHEHHGSLSKKQAS